MNLIPPWLVAEAAPSDETGGSKGRSPWRMMRGPLFLGIAALEFALSAYMFLRTKNGGHVSNQIDVGYELAGAAAAVGLGAGVVGFYFVVHDRE